MRLQSTGLYLAFASFLSVALPGTATAAPATASFSNPAPITINHVGPATPAQSTIDVADLRGTATDVTVTLNGLAHTFPDDIEVLLVAPGGQKVKLMSDVGGSADLTGINLSFNANAAAYLPDSSLIQPGTYLPTDVVEGDPLPAPAPPPPYTISLASLHGPASDLNGTWSLYVADDQAKDGGMIAGGWTLSIATSGGFDGCAAEGYAGSQYALCRQICEADRTGARANGLRGLLEAWDRQFGGTPPCHR